jgi:hypothetical protein
MFARLHYVNHSGAKRPDGGAQIVVAGQERDAASGGEMPANIGAPGFEPGTSPTRTARATRLRHAPNRFECSYRVPATALK